MKLQDIQEILEQADFTTTFLEADQEVPADRLMAFLDLEGRAPDEGQLLELLFVPEVKDDLDGFEILQFFVTFQFDLSILNADQQQDLRNFILSINFGLPLGAFGYNFEGGYIYFKHRSMLHENMNEFGFQQIEQTAALIHFEIEELY